jgi:uncharacterized membrane protein YqjE
MFSRSEDPAEADADVLEDAPGPGWKDRIAAVRRAARALLATRAEIFREELAEKGSHLGKAAAGLSLAAVFAVLGLLLLTALVAAVLARLLGGPIAGLLAAFVLYMAVAAAAALFGARALARVRLFDFPATRDEIRRDLEAVREEGSSRDEGPASAEALAAERASVAPEDRESRVSDIEERFRAGSE